jgi:hypothetical protein
MRVEAFVFGFMATFLGVSDLVYWFTSYDPTGTAALSLCCGFATIIATYMYVTGRRVGPRPEDRPDAEVAEGAGEVGFFSPHSWWPLFTGMSAAITAIGWIFGWWLFLLGVACLMGSASGMVLEYFISPHHDF